MGEPKVVIIGAGIAGLTAAYELSQQHCAVTVVEARERLGGRICSRRAANGAPVELGAEFIHGEHVATWDFIKLAHLTTHQVP